uniref:Ribonuclease H-like domain-containing protein n=1 Tax=Tanacetum cinerariifolium TaxID=118510 RepID=A0A6L2KJ54_TANCI|nr:ribonuclease H-like domain-containing protein [Tanacetum cinerariifolium]
MATLTPPELGPPAILAIIDMTPYNITEELVRSRLQLADDGGIADLTILEIYSGMDNLGYVTEGKLTFFKNKFSPQWRFLVHTLLHCLSTKSRSWDQFGDGAEVAEQAIPHPMPAPDQSSAHLPTPSKPQTSDLVAPVLDHDHSSDPHETDAGSFPTMEDAPLGGDFHTSPLRSSHAPPTGQPLGGEEDPITLTALSSVVLTLVQKVHSLEAELHDHKRLFKDVVGKLVKKVKTLEVKLKTKKRKLVVSDSDQQDSDTQHVDLDALCALANAAVAVDSDIPSGSNLKILTASPCAPTAVPLATSGVPTGASAVPPATYAVSPGASIVPPSDLAVPPGDSTVPAGKSPMVEEYIPVKARTFKQMEEDRLGDEAAKRLHDEEMAQMERERAEVQRKRQQEVLDSAMYYNEFDWLNISAQVEDNASLSKTLLDDDVFEDNFLARMVALIKKKRQALAEQLFKESKVQSHSQIQAFSRTLKRPGPVLDEPSTKRPKSPEAPTPSMPAVPISPVVSLLPSSRTRRKSLGRKHMHNPKSTLLKLDIYAPAQTFLKVVVNEDSDDEDSDDEVWFAVVGWEVLPTPLGEINALYRIDGSTKHFATLRQILHIVDRQDLMKLYGLVVQYYKSHHVAGAGMLFWEDLQVLFDSQAGGKGSCVWQNQHLWEIRSWRLYILSNVHVLETMSGEVLSMFTDVSYPLSIKLMERMLMHKLEINSNIMGNDLTTAEQLIQFIKNQLVTAHASSV